MLLGLFFMAVGMSLDLRLVLDNALLLALAAPLLVLFKIAVAASILRDGDEGDDVVSETEGVRLVVDPVSLDLVAGSTVDFVESLGGAAFKVENPQAAAGCGCGSSFGI